MKASKFTNLKLPMFMIYQKSKTVEAKKTFAVVVFDRFLDKWRISLFTYHYSKNE